MLNRNEIGEIFKVKLLATYFQRIMSLFYILFPSVLGFSPSPLLTGQHVNEGCKEEGYKIKAVSPVLHTSDERS